MDIKNHYKSLFKKHGISHHSVQWSSQETQVKRFQALAQKLQPTSSVIDMGAGLGDLLKFLKTSEWSASYLGLDFVEEFVAEAQRLYPDAAFRVFDLNKEDIPTGYDWVLASGIFNNACGNNDEFLKHSLEKMFRAATVGVSFNCLSTYVDYKSEGLHYFDPCTVFDYCKRFITKRVILDHSYLIKDDTLPFEFTVHLLK
jgi:cyclopropane fatty-acyl-phospholipid synthase-like methyltransferase